MDFLSDMFTDLCELIYRAVADILSWILALLGEWDWVALSDEIYYAAIPFVPQFQVVVAASYALVIVVGGLIIMSQEALQTRYSVREIAPRLIVGFLLSGLAVTICYEAFKLNWGIVSAFLDTPSGWVPEANAETQAFEDEFGQLGWSIEGMTAADYLLATVYKLVCIVAVAILLVTTILRNIAWFFVVALSPAALACHGLPMTERFAVYWWRMLGACLASSIGQSILIWIYLQMNASLYFGMINDIVPMDGVYAIVLVWMMWRLHIECFKIARGRPISIPGSRMLAAFVMSKAATAGHGRKREISVPDTVWGRKMQAPWNKRGQDGNTPPDRFPDLPPEPEGFNEWAGFRAGADARRTAEAGAPDGPPSRLQDAAPVPAEGGQPVRVRPVTYPDGGHGPVPADPRKGPEATSPLADAAPAEVPIESIPDGTLLRTRPPEAPPKVRVRQDQVVPLAQRRTEATDANREREADATAAANKQQAQARQEQAERRQQAAKDQAELRRKATAAMAAMAARNGKDATVHEVPPAREAHAFPPPQPAPKPEGGK
jgi:hypothetical protein